jgi:hypothetical protein
MLVAPSIPECEVEAGHVKLPDAAVTDQIRFHVNLGARQANVPMTFIISHCTVLFLIGRDISQAQAVVDPTGVTVQETSITSLRVRS